MTDSEAAKGNRKASACINVLKILLPLLAFIVPMAILYLLYPASFEATWKGRTYYLFFAWLVLLEIILSWEELQTSRLRNLGSLRALCFCAALALPTCYVIIANFGGLNAEIVNWSLRQGIGWVEMMPLTIEYLVFVALFIATVFLMYGRRGILKFSVSCSLLLIIGLMYLTDNVYPYGRFAPLQIVVPTTTRLAAQVLNLMGFATQISEISRPDLGLLPFLYAVNRQNPSMHAGFLIGWPCAGVESLLIYAVTIALFLKKSRTSWWHGIIYFAIGAVITYSINILRIVTIFLIEANHGPMQTFHDYYGQLYSITWIIAYPLMIIGAQSFWSRIKGQRETIPAEHKQSEDETRIYS